MTIDPKFYSLQGPLSLAKLIEGLGVHLEPHFYDELIETPSALAGASPKSITFFQDKRRKSDLESAKATACLVTERLAPQVADKRIIPIISAAPRAHFARICSKLVTESAQITQDKISPTADIHPTAVIEGGVSIGDRTRIGPYAVISEGVTIGADCCVGAHTHLSFCTLGKSCRIKPGAVIGGVGFGIAKDEQGLVDLPHLGRAIIGDYVTIGSQSCVDRGQLGDTVLGNHVKIDNLVQVAHNVTIGDGSMLAGHVGISGSCTIGKNVQMGGNVGLADHLTIGDNVMIAARAGVMHDIPAGEAWSGIPAMPIREHMRVINATRKLVKKPATKSE